MPGLLSYHVPPEGSFDVVVVVLFGCWYKMLLMLLLDELSMKKVRKQVEELTGYYVGRVAK